MSAASLLFIIVYNFLYYFLYLVLFGFLVVTPIDLIYQAATVRRNYDILVILVVHVATILIVAFIYASRLYINRSVLASIPKSWVPIEKGDVPRDVRQMIVESLGRSAAIAYEARPRVPLVVLAQEPATAGGGGTRQGSTNSGGQQLSLSRTKKSAVSDEAVAVEIAPQRPVWGDIEHPGWASPTSPDLPNLQYDTVISELPNLIEAKAITLAPPDPESHTEPSALDPDAVALLERPSFMGIREYLTHLTDLAVLAPLPTTADFLTQYESARFSPRPLTNDQFRSLMHLFAQILRNMHPLNPSTLSHHYDDNHTSSSSSSSFFPPSPSVSESDIDNDAPLGTTSSSSINSSHGLGVSIPHPHHNRSGGGLDRRDSSSTASSTPRWRRPGMGGRDASWQYRTAPTTPRSRHTVLSRAESAGSAEIAGVFQRTGRVYSAGGQTSSSSASVSVRSGGSGASRASEGSGSVAGSVGIRLARREREGLPYVLTYEGGG
ncbi:hypothetical protein N0V88_000594 [Collariella sp. IMI 366227]|nr:hypothetical protein N0V88_000594 [Collariella sp. IMI 366227]